MKNYRAKYNLKLNEIIETDIEKRVYINNHLIAIDAKIHFVCRKKIKAGEIKSYRILSFNPLKVKLIHPNDDDVILSASEILQLSSNNHMQPSVSNDVTNSLAI